MRTILALLLASTVLLAGCTDEPGTTPTPTTTPTGGTPTPPTTPAPATNDTGNEKGNDTAPELTLEVAGVPALVLANTTFQFTLFVNGTENLTSDHIGAHYADNDTAPVASAMKSCAHDEGELPGAFNVTCTLAEPGTWHVFGHVRLALANGTQEYWAEPAMVHAANYTLATTGVPPTATNGETFNFTLDITGAPNLTSDHIGAHWGNATSTSANTTLYPTACDHTEGALVGTYQVTCTIDSGSALPKSVYLRGHVRLTVDGQALHFWGPEHEIVVTGSLL